MNRIPLKRIGFTICGLVQGVGFRPFLHRLANEHHITGWARNTGDGLEGELEGTEAGLEAFLDALQTSPPPLAEVLQVHIRTLSSPGFPASPKTPETTGHFQILESEATPFDTLVSPDMALCPDCRRELFSPADRRYRYPFINCTNCGPRYSIIRDLPYDRERTVMNRFPMCEPCGNEYAQIENRRYHAQPNACPSCGPEAFFLSADGEHEGGDPFSLSQKCLAGGGLLAVGGTGGIHLACDARNEAAVKRLREKKQRMHKPFALMCRSLDTVREFCSVSGEEAKLLEGSRRPIVLLAARRDHGCGTEDSLPSSLSAASGTSPRIGVMLPYTPLHELLMDGTYGGTDVIILTSANRPGCPVLTENGAALETLNGIADGFLLHNRPIANRCDDSLVTLWEGHPYFFRRSRGYAPLPLSARQDGTGIFAMGAEQKASFALGRGRHIFLSPHIGDLKNAETLAHYREAMQLYRHLFRLTPSVYVCDDHPDYLSSVEAHAAAAREGVPVLTVQHHFAHMVSCMEDNALDGLVFGIIWDGTGLAPDHSVWGGEWLAGDASSYKRQGSIRPLHLIGGDKATGEIGRIGFALLHDSGMTDCGLSPLSPEKVEQMQKLLDTPFTANASSIGRLFDGICSLLCGKKTVEYEGEGAVLLESLSPFEEPDFSLDDTAEALSYPRCYYTENGVRIWDTRPLVRGICADVLARRETPQTVLRFLATLCCVARDQTAALNVKRLPVVLSGGVFQNRFLLSGITQLLRNAGFTVYSHRQVSPNDEGICLGQLAVARAAFPNLFKKG